MQNKSELTHINICLVGCVSAGKSTILNAFFGQDYAQCKIKRTTMIPNKFIETDDSNQSDSFKKINNTISDINKQIYTYTQNGNKLNLEDYGNELTFYVENMEMNIGQNIKICIYDIPGLNDAKTKYVYYQYLKENFHKFNIILFVVDIQSGLNTSDEMDILNFLVKNIKKHESESNKNINLLSIVNKADDMQLTGDKLEVLGELGEMFEQVYNTIKDKFKIEKIDSNILGCIPICGLDSHLYRMIKKFRNIDKLTDENILRIGINEEGSKFRKYSKEEQKKKVQLKIQDDLFVDDMIKLSGFSQIENCLIKYIGIKGSNMITENVLCDYEKIPEMTNDNIIENIKIRVKTLSLLKIYELDKYILEMNNLIKKFNTIIYERINKSLVEEAIKNYYQKIINSIKIDLDLKNEISKFLDLDIYPSYLVDRILELTLNKFSNNVIMIEQLYIFELLSEIGHLNLDIMNLLINTILQNSKGINTFNTICRFSFKSKITKILDLLKESENFLGFLRFILMNNYLSCNAEELIPKLLLYQSKNEILMKQFIEHLLIEKKLTDIKNQYEIYLKLPDLNSEQHNLELYYLSQLIY